ncbi:uncharacterized protein LOC131646408 [Vicia villosa]|uniref:uncharacterized protein LOC131646408 n=1 Tax=Vicia villosa TaxID=3911 RepID=UPI00273A8936|nr:uncharacterized protein LOC131646408 [Vicia villosa]
MEKSGIPKRPREAQIEKDLDFEESSKRHKPYNHILSLLDLEEEESTTQDLSPMMTTLQQEITCSSNNYQDTLLISQNDQNNLTSFGCNTLEDDSALSCFSSTSSQHVLKEEEEDDEKLKVMRHLLQASDDELGIPSSSGDYYGLVGFGGEEYGFNGGDEFSSSLCDKLWELEDERANYYDLLQSELFLWGN